MKRREFLKAAALGALAMSLGAKAAEKARPNVIVVLVDDYGYECVGANGSTSYKTPNVDKLAAGGARFERCYAQPLCTPTRNQIMTGLYNVRNYTRFGMLLPDQTTFGNIFKKAGYATCITGKWQLSNGLEGPGHFGFDEYCLWQLDRRPCRYANPGLEINGEHKDYTKGEYGPDLVSDYALDFVTRQKDKPFFLYYPMMLTHAPYQPTPDSPDYDPKAIGEGVNQAAKHFVDMVAYTDKLVGKLVARLEELGLREKTLILFTGDNGTGRGTVSMMGDIEVIGGKGTMAETGMRVPLVANWPGTVKPGLVSADLVDMTDFLPTICDAAGVALPAGIPFDGRSFLPQAKGEKGNPREWIYCWYAPSQGKVDEPREFAESAKYRLFRSGEFQEIDTKRLAEKKIEGELSPEAAAAKKMLQAALDQYKDARTAKVIALTASEVESKPKKNKAGKEGKGKGKGQGKGARAGKKGKNKAE